MKKSVLLKLLATQAERYENIIAELKAHTVFEDDVFLEEVKSRCDRVRDQCKIEITDLKHLNTKLRDEGDVLEKANKELRTVINTMTALLPQETTLENIRESYINKKMNPTVAYKHLEQYEKFKEAMHYGLKIAAIKTLLSMTDCGLKAAKTFVEEL